jgi:hypothetical protein
MNTDEPLNQYDIGAPPGDTSVRPFFCCVLALTGVASTPTRAADPKALLSNPINLGRSIESAPLKDVFEYLNDKFELPIRIDEAAFKKDGATGIPDKEIRLPKVEDVPLHFVLEVAAHQVGGTVRVDKDGVTIIPGKRDPAEILGPASDKLKKELAENSPLPEKNGNQLVPLRDALEYFGDQAEITIIVADWPTPIAAPAKGEKPVKPDPPISEKQCRLPAGTKPLQTWLELLAKQVDCKVVPAGEVVLIVPLPKEKK